MTPSSNRSVVARRSVCKLKAIADPSKILVADLVLPEVLRARETSGTPDIPEARRRAFRVVTT